MADFEADNAIVRESLAQVQSRMDMLHGNMEAILELLQTQRAHASNSTDDNATRAAGVANTVVTNGTAVKTLVEIAVPTSENLQLVPADTNRPAAAYPWGMPQNFTAHFTNGWCCQPEGRSRSGSSQNS